MNASVIVARTSGHQPRDRNVALDAVLRLGIGRNCARARKDHERPRQSVRLHCSLTPRALLKMPSQSRDVYPVRAQISGALVWTCPTCGHANRNRVFVGHWRATCRDCKRIMVFGLRWYYPAPGSNSRTETAPDSLVPEVSTHELELIDCERSGSEPLPIAKASGPHKPTDPLHSPDD